MRVEERDIRTRGRVGIFGGSFDPPHLGHLIVAEAAREQLDLDRVVWIPAALPPHKEPDDLSKPGHRLEMVTRAIRGNEAFRCSSLEVDRGGTSYTVDTLEVLTKEEGTDDFYVIVGSDSYREFENWRRPSRIVELAELVVYPRGQDVRVGQSAYPRLAIEAPVITISSTMIRSRIREGKSVRYLVTDDVLDYIEECALYR